MFTNPKAFSGVATDETFEGRSTRWRLSRDVR